MHRAGSGDWRSYQINALHDHAVLKTRFKILTIAETDNLRSHRSFTKHLGFAPNANPFLGFKSLTFKRIRFLNRCI